MSYVCHCFCLPFTLLGPHWKQNNAFKETYISKNTFIQQIDFFTLNTLKGSYGYMLYVLPVFRALFSKYVILRLQLFVLYCYMKTVVQVPM